jgi:arsenate reductase
VITVCDSAAGESCPLYFGKSVKMHWGLKDPSKVEGSDGEKQAEFLNCIAEIEGRVEQLKTLANQGLDKDALVEKLKALGAS